MILQDPLMLFTLMTFLIVYIFFFVYLWYRLKLKQKYRTGDKILTMEMVHEAQKNRKYLYKIAQKIIQHQNSSPMSISSYEISDNILTDTETQKLYEILNIYNSISLGISKRQLNTELIDTFLGDDMRMAHKIFSPYFQTLRRAYNSKYLFASFEYSDWEGI